MRPYIHNVNPSQLVALLLSTILEPFVIIYDIALSIQYELAIIDVHASHLMASMSVDHIHFTAFDYCMSILSPALSITPIFSLNTQYRPVCMLRIFKLPSEKG